MRRARHAAVERRECGDATSAQCDPLRHLGDHAYLGVIAAASRDEQHARIAADVRGQSDRHAGEHHDIVQRNKFQGCHELKATPNS